MPEFGKMNRLKIVKKVDFGVYLAESADADSRDRVLLPGKQVPEEAKLGDELEVFLYKDSKDRPIATLHRPLIVSGEISPLRVVSVSKIGAFLDMGIERDLFLPFREQERKVKEGDTVLVRMYVDKSGRLCASMKGLYHHLSTNPPYRAGDDVTGRVYEFSDNFGTFVAVDDKYSAMLPKHEKSEKLKIGDVISARVIMVKEDGKLDISMREAAHVQIDDDAEHIMSIIEEYGGVLPFGDKSPAGQILKETGLSKNAFKRAVGRLYKERRVEVSDTSVRAIVILSEAKNL